MNSISKLKASRGRTPDGLPNPIDVHVGSRIRLRREFVNLSQTQFSEKVGISFQQIQKYEMGKNRISASRLWDIAQVLNIPITYFFAEMDEDTANQSPRRFIVASIDKDIIPELNEPLAHKEISQLIGAYQKIDKPEYAELILKLAQALVHC